jgi:CheY-like chemotaxis protein
MTRFNESIDQSLTHAVRSFVEQVGRDRDAMLAKEQAARGDAEAANRAKDLFLATLSHEMRTPLTPVLAAVTALLQRGNVARSDRPMLEMIRRNVELEARLIEDLLDLSRISINKLQLRLETVDMHTAIRDVLDMCAEDAHAKGLKITSELRARKSIVNGDPARLRQIVWNLLKNAIKFTPAGGLVIIRTANLSTSRLTLQVADTGIGIEPSLIGKLFSVFEQDEIGRQHGGLGLGLAISKALVEAHGGTISATSEGKGRGATFTVDLPVATGELAAVPEAPTEKPQSPPRKLRIMLVEDHGDTARILSTLLENEGHHVKVATTMQDAVKLSAEGELDLIISDLGLPDGTGYELMQQLKLPSPVPAIALSGYGADTDIKRSRESGFRQHITKPVDFGRLLEAIDDATRGGDGVHRG